MGNERWVVPYEFPSYAVSTYGNVMNVRRDSLVTTRFNQRGIKTVSIVDRNGRLTMRSVAVMVAQEFIEKPAAYFNTIIHFNNRREDCGVDNIDWRPRIKALKFHEQFQRPAFLQARHKFELLETGDRFVGFVEPCMRFGLYFMDLLLSTQSGEPAFPTPYHFIRL